MTYQREIPILDHGYVRYVEHVGSDTLILEAARMSTGNPTGVDEEKDDRTLSYLYRNKHMTPFEMPDFQAEFQVPIFDARQMMRHRTFSFNEFSGRYAEMPDLYYIPDAERIQEQDTANKQGSRDTLPRDAQEEARRQMVAATNAARLAYEALLDAGVARETARMVLPLNQYTRFRMKGNLRNWLHFLELRLHPHAQYEVRVVAEAVAAILRELYPKTYALFERYTLGRVS